MQQRGHTTPGGEVEEGTQPPKPSKRPAFLNRLSSLISSASQTEEDPADEDRVSINDRTVIGRLERDKAGLHFYKIVERVKLNRSCRNLTENPEREAALLRSLKHPNIVQLVSFKIKDLEYEFTFPYHEKGDLLSRVQKEGTPPPKQCHAYFRQIVEGLQYLHENSICLRDLSLENVLVANGDVLKLTDFGLAKRYDDGESFQEKQHVGKDEYMSPECYRHQCYDARANDVWSLGVILFMMLSGIEPCQTGLNFLLLTQGTFGGSTRTKIMRTLERMD